MLSEFQDDVTVRKQDEIDKTHNITKSDLNQAVSTLGAFLSVREVFYRIANDLEVTRYCFMTPATFYKIKNLYRVK